MKDAFTVIRKRGIYMQNAVPIGGAMSAVLGLGADIIEKICEDTEGIVSIANYNCPGQIVITGEKTAVKHLYAYAGAQGTCTVVKPQETTKNLFREVTFVNAMEGQGLENGMYKIGIKAFGIQTTDLNGGTNNAVEIWKIISNQRELAESFS